MAKLLTGEIDEDAGESGKDLAARTLGKKGGRARADRMTPERRREIAQKAAQARWLTTRLETYTVKDANPSFWISPRDDECRRERCRRRHRHGDQSASCGCHGVMLRGDAHRSASDRAALAAARGWRYSSSSSAAFALLDICFPRDGEPGIDASFFAYLT